MCTPLIIAGLALTAGSMVVNSIADNQVNNARNDVLHAEALRQRGFNREVDTINTQSQDRYQGFGDAQQERAGELADLFASDVGDPNTAGVLPQSSSNIVNQETDRQMGDAQAYVDQQSGALANMRSFGDLLGEKSLMQARDAGKVGQLGGFKQGSQAVMPYELDDAGKAGDNAKFFADLLRLGGTVATGSGISGGNIANMFGGAGASGGFYPGLNGPSLGGTTSAWGL